MNKKFKLGFVLLSMLFILAGCGGGPDDPIQQTKTYYTTIKVVNSDDEIIKTANVTVDGKTGEGSEGLYSFNLKKGTHNIKINDTTNTYLSYEGQISVLADNEFKVFSLNKDDKTIFFEVLDKNNKPINNAIVSIENVKPLSIEDNVYSFNLEKNHTYEVKVYDSEGFYYKESNNITVNDSKNNYSFNLERKDLDNLEGNLTLTSEYNKLPLDNVEIIYNNNKTFTNENGYFKLENIPVGKVNFEINPLFREKFTLEIDNQKNETKNIEIELGQGFPFNKFNDLITINSNYMLRWDDEEIKYYTNSNNQYELNSLERGMSFIEENFFNNRLKYIEVNEELADLKIIFSNNNTTHPSTIENGIIKFSFVEIDSLNYNSMIIAHELGHSLGLGHLEGSKYEDLMNKESSIDLDNYDSKEKFGVGLLYSLPVKTTNIFN